MLVIKILRVITQPGVCFRQGCQLPLIRLLSILLLDLALNACAGIYLSRTVSWDEDILQLDGRVLSVHGTETYGPDVWGRSGRGLMQEQTIQFSYDGQQVKWESSDRTSYIDNPVVLEIINHTPVLILSVRGWGACDKYGYPRDGLAAYEYQNGRWNRIAINDLPKGVKVNLEGRAGGESAQGQLISEVSKTYAVGESSCARIHPLPNPPLEVLKQKNTEAEMSAQVLVASLQSSSNSPKTVLAGDYVDLEEGCKGVVERTQQIREYGSGGSWDAVGFTIILKDGSQIPFRDVGIKSAQKLPGLTAVTCDSSSIFVVRRQSKDQLLVHRFSLSGTPRDTFRIAFPELTQFFGEGKWPRIWEVTSTNEQLVILFGSYSYKISADLGGILENQVRYTIQLPK